LNIKSKEKVTIYLAYHKTASKWMWNNFFSTRYPCYQINIRELSKNDILREINYYNSDSPIILRTRLEDGLMGTEIYDIVGRIKEIFTDPKIIISPRSQRSLVASHYGQYVMNGGRYTYKKYLNEVVKNKWHYSEFISLLFKAFGKNNVFVYLFEEFVHDKYNLLLNLEKFIGQSKTGLTRNELEKLINKPKMNPQRNDLVIDVALVLNKLRLRHRKNAILPIIKGPSGDHLLVEFVAFIVNQLNKRFNINIKYRNYNQLELLDKAYAKENKNLSKLINRDLKQYNYPGL
jgi:hypothetical protein